jgi:cbb3-type cytochrome oxidase cytochrome c subunit
MPGYKWLFDNKPMDVSLTQKKMQLWRHLEFLTQKVKLQVV